MDDIRFLVAAGELEDDSPTVQPIVNGVPLRELARVVEAAPAAAEGHPDIAGG